MTNDNETIEDIVIDLRREPLAENGAKPWLHHLADRIEAAAKNATMLCHQVCSCDLLAKMEAETAELRNMIEELADALHPFREWFGNQKLIDRAKETVGMKEIGGVK